jgi:glutamate 5-kinase
LVTLVKKSQYVEKTKENFIKNRYKHLNQRNQPYFGKIEDIGMQIAALNDEYEFIIVSSGAIAAAKQFVKLESKGKEIVVKQALASIGQPHLMDFHENFSDLGLLTSAVFIVLF